MKKSNRQKSWMSIAVAFIAIFSLAAIAYPQNTGKKLTGPDRDMMDMMGGTGMDVMHKQMTKDLDPELKGQMDKMHEQCEKMHEKFGENDETDE